MHKLVLISFLFSFSLIAAEPKCFKNRKITYIKNNKDVHETRDVCVNIKKYDFISLSCMKDKKCDAIAKYTEISKVKTPTSKIGDPDLRRCIFAGGKPKFISMVIGPDTHDTHICEFADGSFISIYHKI